MARITLGSAVLACLALLVGGCESPAYREAMALSGQGRNLEALDLCEAELANLSPSQRQDSKVGRLAAQLRGTVTDDVLRQAAEAYQGGTAIPPVGRAIKVLAENLSRDDSAGRLKARLAEYRQTQTRLQEAVTAKLSQAKEKEAAGLWTEAVRALDEAAAVNPADSDIPAERAALIARRDGHYRKAVESAVQTGDWRAAVKALDELKAQSPSPEASLVQQLSSALADLKSKVLRDEVRSLCQKKRYYSAYRAVKEAGLTGPAADELLRPIVQDGTSFYLGLGDEQLKKGADGAAYLAAVKALEMSPTSDAAFDLHKNASDKVDRAIRVQIAVAAFDAPPKEPSAGTQLSDSLIAHLVRTLPYGIEILERSKIDFVLSEKGKKLDEISKQLDVKFFVIGSVSALEVEHQKREQEASAVLKVGTRTVPNPEYQAFAAQFGPDVRRWPSVPPATIREDVTQVVKYRTGDETVSGIMMASARIFDAEKGSVTFAEDFKVRDEAADHYQDAVEAANVQGDPLKLPTDMEMKDRLRAKMVQDVSKVILSLFEARHYRLAQRADYHVERRERDRALEYLGQAHWYCRKDRARLGEADKRVAEIARKALLEYSEP